MADRRSAFNPTLLLFPFVGFLVAVLQPRVQIAGIFNKVENLNNGDCFPLTGLEACEDAWVHHDAGVAYLPCSSKSTRKNWVPALLHLNATALPAGPSTDYVALYTFSTRAHSRLKLVGTPPSFPGLYTHGLSGFVDPDDSETLTLFFINHVPPEDRESAPVTGADSRIEIFETKKGSDELKWITSVKHELVRTPNSVAAVGRREFYFTNDHARKSHWTRKLEILYAEPSDIGYCDASGPTPACSVAASGLQYPNGIVKGTDGLIYSASTADGNVRVWAREANNTLSHVSEETISRPIDNLRVSETTGNIYAATFPKLLSMISTSLPAYIEQDGVSPVEVWRVSNSSLDQGSKYVSEKVFADDGHIVSGVTAAAPYQNQIILTGIATRSAVICTLAEEL